MSVVVLLEEVFNWIPMAECKGNFCSWLQHVVGITAYMSLPIALWIVLRKRDRKQIGQTTDEYNAWVWNFEIQYCIIYLFLVFCLSLYAGIRAEYSILAAVGSIVAGGGIYYTFQWWALGTCGRKRVCMLDEDAEIPEEIQDMLGRDDSLNKLCEWIVSPEMTSNKIVGLFGRWGSGKTFTLHCMANILKEVNFVSVNLWQCNSEKELWKNVLIALEYACFGCVTPFTRLRRFLDRIMLVGADAYIFPKIVYRTFLEEGMSSPSNRLKKYKASMGRRHTILVFDNVERTELDVFHMLLPLVERLRRIEKLTVVLSVSFDAWKYSGSLHRDKLHLFRGAVQKIVEYSYSLPTLKQSQAMNFLLHRLALLKRGADSYIAKVCATLRFDTPRQIVRVIQTLMLCEKVHVNQALLHGVKEEKVLSYVRPVFLVEVLRSQYEAMYTILYEQSYTWTPRGPLPDLQKMVEGKVAAQEEESSDAWYVNMLQRYSVRKGNNKNRYRLLAEEVMDYAHDLLFSSVVEQLNRQSAESVVGAVTQTYAYKQEINTQVALCIVEKLQNQDMTVKQCVEDILQVTSVKEMEGYVLALAKYVMSFVSSSILAGAVDTPMCVRTFMKLLSEYQDLMFTYLKRELNDMIDPRITPYLLAYPVEEQDCNEERMEQLREYINKLTANSKAWVFATLRRIEILGDQYKLDARYDGHKESVYKNIKLFQKLMDTLEPIYNQEVIKSVGAGNEGLVKEPYLEDSDT